MKNKIVLYQVDAFTDKLFHGNPAGVCILEEWLDDKLMQNIAAENNLAETAFVVKNGDSFEIRWFTPTVEVDLCGHATLASAHVLFNYYPIKENLIPFFSSRSGKLPVERQGLWLTLDFPIDSYTQIDIPDILITALQKRPIEAYRGKTDIMLVFASQEDVEEFRPNFPLIESVGGRGVIVTAPGIKVDFVSRFFAPQSGIDEDPVTGSAHTTLAPYWSMKTGKTRMTAHQLSKRGGNLVCEVKDNRVMISGRAVTYLIGEIGF
jgi:PhzF family phenazine biosynthesis protein